MPLTNLGNGFSLQIMKKYTLKELCIMEQNKKKMGQRKKNGLVVSFTINLPEYALGKQRQLQHRRIRTSVGSSVGVQLSNNSVPLRSYEFKVQLKYLGKERNPISSEIIYDKMQLTKAQFVCGIVVVPLQLNNK